jgi:hypothetical protein
MFAGILIGVLLVPLLVPSWLVLVHFGRLNAKQALRRAWPIWISLVVMAAGLIFFADAVGLRNPLGYTLGICIALGMSGASFLWWRNYGRC